MQRKVVKLNLCDDPHKNTYFKWFMKLPQKLADEVFICNGQFFMFENQEEPFRPQSYMELLRKCKDVKLERAKNNER